MVRQSARLALLIGAIAAVAVTQQARAQDKTTAPKTRTITVTECVPETYKVKRTVHRTECKTEEYDAVKCVMTQEERTRECVVVTRVPVMSTEKRKVCKTVTCYEDKTVMKKCYKNVEETVMKKKCVSLGHWECCEAPRLFGGHGCGDPCKDSCNNTRTVKRWVHCPKYECCPVKVCKRVCVEVPTVCKVKVCKQVWEECAVQVCNWKCTEEKKTVKYTVCVPKQVTYKATRTVRVCVPHEEEVTCTRMVTRTREVAVADCAPSCDPCARRHLFSRGHDRCDRGCDRGSCCR